MRQKHFTWPADSGRNLTRQQKNKLRLSKKIRDNRYKPRYEDCSLGCGGQAVWCSSCECFTSTCCVDYGTCMCS